MMTKPTFRNGLVRSQSQRGVAKRMIFGALVCAGVMLTLTGPVYAGYVFVGSFEVGDGPLWTTQPEVLSAREAAALLFGGHYTDYAISTNSNTTDPATINHMAWVDGYGRTEFLYPNAPASEDFKIDVGPVGYSGGDYSAYVYDHDYKIGQDYQPGNTSGNNVNFVWRKEVVPSVPEPSTFALLGIGGIALAGYGWRRKQRQAS